MKVSIDTAGEFATDANRALQAVQSDKVISGKPQVIRIEKN